MRARLLHTGLLAFGLLVGCGGSASRGPHDDQAPGGAGGTAGDRAGAAGENAKAGSAASAASGGSGTDAGGTGIGAGGTSDGGDAQDLGGMASAGAAPVISLPPGCRARTPMETADICSLAVDCDASPSVRTNCYRLDSGQWECQCANQERIFRVENVAGLQACTLSSQLCADNSPKLGKESCEHANDVSDQDTCTIDIACGRPIDLGATTGARAWLMRSGLAHCNRDSVTTSFNCSCVQDGETSYYGLLADGGDVACGPLADFCSSNETPTFTGKETCLPGYFSSDSQSCQRFASCGGTLPLADGVSLAHFEQRFATCVASSGAGSDCSCSEADSVFSFHLSTPPDDSSCESSIPNCDPNAVIKPTGTASCTPQAPDTSDGDLCQASLGCVQDATVDDRSIVVDGNLVLLCQRTGPGTAWWCSCASGADTARFQLGATGASASQACSQAPAACLQHLSLHLGPSGDTVQPPNPLP